MRACKCVLDRSTKYSNLAHWALDDSQHAMQYYNSTFTCS